MRLITKHFHTNCRTNLNFSINKLLLFIYYKYKGQATLGATAKKFPTIAPNLDRPIIRTVQICKKISRRRGHNEEEWQQHIKLGVAEVLGNKYRCRGRGARGQDGGGAGSRGGTTA